jgi:NAD(P)H-dependent FMN reductase
MPNVLVVSGASRPESNLRAVVAAARARVEAAGAEVRVVDLAATKLPMMEANSEAQAGLPEVIAVRELARWADGYVLVTPEYHGNMSGALKNWFDFHYLELAGKFAGVISVTGGGTGDMSIVSVKNCFAWCHGFTLPFHATVRPDDVLDDRIVDLRLLDRIDRIAHDVVRYAPVVRACFEAARALGHGPEAGVAGLHADEPAQ